VAGRFVAVLDRALPCVGPALAAVLGAVALGRRALVVDEASAEHLETVLEGIDETLALVLPDVADVSALAARLPRHVVLGAADLVVPPADWEPRAAASDAIAYLLFTSGSTGVPKGVMVAHANVRHFLDVMLERYGIDEHDRLSQTFDMTFDLSVFDMFMAWDRGACVCCLPQSALLQPARFIQESELTVWFSVPSLALLMRRLGMLKPDRYPTLRWSLFCGEPLPAELAQAWADAAPNSIVENLYGPTELTIACTLYRWEPERGEREARHGVVPIGAPYPGMTVLVADDELRPVEPGAEGELLLSGPQVTLGYWQDEEKTRAAFVLPPGASELHYRTGDLVRAPVGDEPLLYVGRIDHQIKVNGYRVELGEVEAALREASGAGEVVALGWPRTESGASGVAAFVQGASVDAEALRDALAATLPYYMVPRTITAIEQFPLNANGKYDRNALVRLLEGTA
jgi:amino acid adenylation domain-containing protein